jgi:hypothetical protein
MGLSNRSDKLLETALLMGTLLAVVAPDEEYEGSTHRRRCR